MEIFFRGGVYSQMIKNRDINLEDEVFATIIRVMFEDSLFGM